MLIHLVDGTQDDVVEAWRTVRTELEAYGEGLAEKTEILALTKIDALDQDLRTLQADALAEAAGQRPLLVSGVSGEGLTELLRAALAEIRRSREAEAQAAASDQGWRP